MKWIDEQHQEVCVGVDAAAKSSSSLFSQCSYSILVAVIIVFTDINFLAGGIVKARRPLPCCDAAARCYVPQYNLRAPFFLESAMGRPLA